MIEADPITIGLWALVVITGYHSLDFLFPRLTERFQALSGGRRRYVIKNLLKSGLLLVLGIACTPSMFRFFYYNSPDNEWIHTMGVLYAIPDVYALWWVRGMLYQSTIFHHVSVAMLATVGLFLDHNIDTHWVAMLVYAYLSMWTGVVNFYLGARFLLKRDNPTEDNFRRHLAAVSLAVYYACCTVNWLYQLHTVMKWLDFRLHELSLGNFVGLMAYCAMLFFIIKDDLILMGKLSRECLPYQLPATQAEQTQHLLETLEALVDKKDRTLLKNPDGNQIAVQTSHSVPLNEVMQQIKHFRTPYSVSVTHRKAPGFAGSVLVFEVDAFEPKEIKPNTN